MTLSEKEWSVLFKTVERSVKELKKNAFIKRDKPSYISVWNDFATDANDILTDNASATFKDITSLLPDNPQTLYDIGQSLLKLVPPMKEIIIISTKTRSKFQLTVLQSTEEITTRQAAVHDNMYQSDDDSTLSGLRRHVAELDDKFQKSFSTDDLNERITKMIETELPTVVAAAVKELTSTQEEFQKVTIDSAKLRGDIQNLDSNITDLRSVCTSLQDQEKKEPDVHRKSIAYFAQ